MESPATAASPALPSGFNSTLNGIVLRIHQAYRAGRLVPVETDTATSRRKFLVSMEQLAAARLSRRELLFVSRCKGYCDEARYAAGLNDVAAACRAISAAQMFADVVQISPEARLLCRSEIVPAEAYLDELWGDLHFARERVLESLRIDEELEQRYSYTGTHAHRMHLLNRLVRLEAGISGLVPAMKLAAVVLRYQFERNCRLPIAGAWGPQYTCLLPPGLLRFFTVQLVAEIAGIVAEVQSAELRPAIEMLLNSDALEQDQEFWSSHVRSWLELKALFTEDATGYLLRCADYLSSPVARVPAFWNTAALDAAIICRAFAQEQSLPFRQEVLCDLGNVNSFPRSLRRTVVRMRAELGWAALPVRGRAGGCKVLL